MRNNENISQVMTMVLVFLVCWGPYAVLSIIGVLGFDKVQLIYQRSCQLSDELSWCVHSMHITTYAV